MSSVHRSGYYGFVSSYLSEHLRSSRERCACGDGLKEAHMGTEKYQLQEELWLQLIFPSLCCLAWLTLVLAISS